MKFSIILFALFYFIKCYSQIDSIIHEVDSVFDDVQQLKGNVLNKVIFSNQLEEYRSISIYEPQNLKSLNNLGVLFVTDGILLSVASKVEFLIQNKSIRPIIIVSINPRGNLPVDSIFGTNVFDFRGMEFLKDQTIFRNGINGVSTGINQIKDSFLIQIINDRYNRFSSFIVGEVVDYIKKSYKVSKNHKKWTIGGYSNGGAFVYGLSCDYPGIFGNSIIMSPGGGSLNSNIYDFKNSQSSYFISAGIHEANFLKESLNYIPLLEENNLKFIHKRYNAGHDFNMWLTFYLDSVKSIYNY
jgi:enterochelin esterase-like enzyme